MCCPCHDENLFSNPYQNVINDENWLIPRDKKPASAIREKVASTGSGYLGVFKACMYAFKRASFAAAADES
jgi:hypothetical protein